MALESIKGVRVMVSKTKKRSSTANILHMPLPLYSKAIPSLFLIIAVLGIFLHRINASPIEHLRVVFTDLLVPVFATVSEPAKEVANKVSSVAGMRDLRVDNIRLTEENRRLQQWYSAALRLEAENRGLKSLLNFKSEADYSFISTRVVVDTGGSFIKSLLLPVGTDDNVVKGQAVMAKEAMIGRIVESGQTASRVLMVTDLNSHIPVLIEGSRYKGILAGYNGDTMFLEHLPLDSQPELGARIITSGDGGLLPPNLPIGTIVSNQDGKIQVQPIDNLGQLEYVRVIDFSIDDSIVSGDIMQ